MIEVERKYRIINIAAFRRRLSHLRLPQSKIKRQIDTYYSPPNESFLGKPRYLRIRESIHGRKIKARFEYHVPYGRYAAREYEVAIGDAHTLYDILKRLGFVRELVVRKVREEWERGGVEIELDRVQGLGNFVELEVMGQSQLLALKRIDKLARELGLSDDDRAEGMNYFTMLLRKRRPVAYRRHYGSHSRNAR